jgi:hypothetical protein
MILRKIKQTMSRLPTEYIFVIIKNDFFSSFTKEDIKLKLTDDEQPQ